MLFPHTHKQGVYGFMKTEEHTLWRIKHKLIKPDTVFVSVLTQCLVPSLCPNYDNWLNLHVDCWHTQQHTGTTSPGRHTQITWCLYKSDYFMWRPDQLWAALKTESWRASCKVLLSTLPLAEHTSLSLCLWLRTSTSNTSRVTRMGGICMRVLSCWPQVEFSRNRIWRDKESHWPQGKTRDCYCLGYLGQRGFKHC